MLCQNCGKYEATTHVKRIINGEATEAHLCSDCAKAMGYGDAFSGFGNIFSDFFGSFFNGPEIGSLSAHTLKCEKCGSTFSDIVESGKVGCADCYKTFLDKLLPSLRRLHGKTKHEGKIPNVIQAEAAEEKDDRTELEKMESDLQAAIDAQEFEKAAKLRDRIKEMKSEEGGSNE